MAKKDEEEQGNAQKIELTIEQLKEDYPELVDVIRAETIEDLEKADAERFCDTFPEQERNMAALIKREMAAADIETFRKAFPGQVKKLAEQGSNVNLAVKGFLLDIDDPYAAGTLRNYQRISGEQGLRLPYVLPYKGKKTVEAINNYIVRASGAGDIERVKRANEALEKCK